MPPTNGAHPPFTAPTIDGRPPRVLIAGINYPPEEIGIAPYTAGLAEHLTATGYEVSVLTGMPYYPQWRVENGYRHRVRARETIDGIDVRRYRTYVPKRQSAGRRMLFEAGFFANCVLTARLPRPDAIIGIVPNLGGAGIAALLSKRFHVPYGLIFQDLVGAAAAQSGISGGSKVAGATRSIEGWCARGAAYVGVVSEGFVDYLVDSGVNPDRIVHLRNWSHIQPPDRDRDEVRRELGWKPDQIVILHAGAMGLKQGLENVMEAARRAVSVAPKLRFVLMGDGNQRHVLEDNAAELSNTRLLPLQPEADFSNVLAAADLLLVNQRSSVTDMALPSKLTSYFVAGRPIVAAVSPESCTALEVLRSRAGVVVPADQPDMLVDTLAELAANHAKYDQLAAAGPRYATRHLSAEVSLANAETLIAHMLNGHADPSHGVGIEAPPGGGRWPPGRRGF
jgi:colanic acid biosynthesis glycosyl transferase WcaI